MPRVVPLDEFVTDEWYPGFKPSYKHAQWAVEPFDTFKKEDENRFWFLDFHWPRGLSPMGLIWCEDGYSWGTQLAAQTMPLPPGKGIAQRVGGTHVYAGAIDCTSPWEIAARAKRATKCLPSFLEKFPQIWADRAEEISEDLKYFESYDYNRKSLAELGTHLCDTRTFYRRTFEIHFELMYPLLANYVSFYGLCNELKIDPGEIAKFCQGYDTKILETDRELWRLANEARRLGATDIFAGNRAEDIYAALGKTKGGAAAWKSIFDDWLKIWGHRTEGTCDINLPSWIEDPTPALGMIKTFLQKPKDFDFDAARRATVEERDTAVEKARAKLSRSEREQFDAALAMTRHANFAWWNDEHAFLIDLRSNLPMRHTCQAIARTVGADREDDTLFLFWPELMDLCAGRRRWVDYRSVAKERRDYYLHWQAKRATMPKVLGTIPDEVQDPVLIEIFGMHKYFFNAVKSGGAGSRQLVGVAASVGVARGIARVLHTSDELHRIRPGDILVCESTSPNWTPAFGKISACVCDSGGTLAHASIVSREYRIPCVVGVGLATSLIRDGDHIEVDGTSGVVRLAA